MTTTTIDLEQAAQNDFQDMTTDQLRVALTELGEIVDGRWGDAKLRSMLAIRFGRRTAPPPPAPVKKQTAGGSPFGPTWPLVPPLHTGGKWGGKMYRVIITSRLAEDKGCPLTWENWTVNAALNEPVDLPEPHYMRLVDCVTDEIRQKRIETDSGETWEKLKTPFRQFNFQPLGVTPGTEHLPGSMWEYYRAFAAARDNFINLTRPQLDRIHSACFPETNAKEHAEKEDERVRHEILEFCGIRREVELEDVA